VCNRVECWTPAGLSKTRNTTSKLDGDDDKANWTRLSATPQWMTRYIYNIVLSFLSAKKNHWLSIYMYKEVHFSISDSLIKLKYFLVVWAIFHFICYDMLLWNSFEFLLTYVIHSFKWKFLPFDSSVMMILFILNYSPIDLSTLTPKNIINIAY